VTRPPPEPLVFHPRPPGEVTRRRALGVMAASLALASTGCSRPPRERIYPWVDMPELHAAGAHVYYASAFVRDGYAHGVRIGTCDGRPIKVEGNPLHPSSLGRTDVFAQASVLQLWDPDRSQAPAQRDAPVSGWQAFETQWRREESALLARRGEGLHLLTGPVTSPTLRAQVAALLRRYPAARWHQHSPVRDTAAEAGAAMAFGRAVDTVFRFDRAECVVALGSDPFSHGPGAVRHAADWSRRRGAIELLAVETTPGLFGARAHRRLALAPAHIDAMVQRLAAQQPAPGFED
jgi:molybdopterin-containing oxidoreductase family iron-sulfur binding subunit